jgi:hypothetical protein
MALKIEDVQFDSTGRASILRRLGDIAIKESDIEKAKEYYNESLKFEESASAREQLLMIEELRKKKSN